MREVSSRSICCLRLSIFLWFGSASGLLCGQVFSELVELTKPQLGGFLMMAGRGFGHRRVVYQTGLAKDLRGETVFARRPPRVSGGLPVALQLVQPRQRLVDLRPVPPHAGPPEGLCATS